MGRRRLMTGFAAVGAGAAIAGVGSYVLLIVAARSLAPDDYGSFSTYWSIAVILGFGLYLPIEQETVRRIAPVPSEPGSPRLLSTVAVVAAAATGLLLVVLAGSAWWSIDAGFLSASLLAAVAATGVAYAVLFPVRGVVSGRHRPAVYAGILSTEGALRIVLPLLLALAGAPVEAFALAVAAAALLSVVPAIPELLAVRSIALAPARFSGFAGAVAHLVVAALAAQALINGPVLLARAAAPDDPVLAGQVLALLSLARIPTFVYQAAQVLYLPRVAQRFAAGDIRGSSQIVLATAGLALVIGAVVGVVLMLAGDTILAWLFGPAMVLHGIGRALLIAGSALFLVALVLSDAAVAIGRHRAVSTTWLVSVATGLVVFLLPIDATARVGASLFAGAAVAAVSFSLVVARAHRALERGRA